MFLWPLSVTLPAAFPLMQAAGCGMTWVLFGIVKIFAMEIAVPTPPMELNLQVIQGFSIGPISIGELSNWRLDFVARLLAWIVLFGLAPE